MDQPIPSDLEHALRKTGLIDRFERLSATDRAHIVDLIEECHDADRRAERIKVVCEVMVTLSDSSTG